MNTKEKSFSERVYDIVSQIPKGYIMTYGQIALMLGCPRAARQVGGAMSRAPGYLPCHRVVNGRGTLSPDYVFGGTVIQRTMLESEGITFLSDGTINIARHIWKGKENSGLI